MKKFLLITIFPVENRKSSLQLLCSGPGVPLAQALKPRGVLPRFDQHILLPLEVTQACHHFLVSQKMSRRHRLLLCDLWSPQDPASSAVPSRMQYTHPNWYPTQAGRFPPIVHSLPADSKSVVHPSDLYTCNDIHCSHVDFL